MSDIVVVLGPWGSGTSAAIGSLALMGFHTCPPHFQTYDPRTPNSFEPHSLRSLIIPNFNEFQLKFVGPDRGAMPGLLKNWLARERTVTKKPVAVKLPHLCFFIPEMIKAWNPVFILIERPLSEIEQSRLRRNWAPHLGAMGATRAYAVARHDLKEMNQDFLTVSYADLTKNSEHTIDIIARWLGLSTDPAVKQKAVQFVAR